MNETLNSWERGVTCGHYSQPVLLSSSYVFKTIQDSLLRERMNNINSRIICNIFIFNSVSHCVKNLSRSHRVLCGPFSPCFQNSLFDCCAHHLTTGGKEKQCWHYLLTTHAHMHIDTLPFLSSHTLSCFCPHTCFIGWKLLS